jgi:acyl dehydratase
MASLKLEVNQQIPSVTKKVTRESINQFESCGILDRQNIHNNPALAQRRLGTSFRTTRDDKRGEIKRLENERRKL